MRVYCSHVLLLLVMTKLAKVSSEKNAVDHNLQASVWWLYMIETDKGQLYTGISTNIDRRFAEHVATYYGIRNARGAKFFRSQQPVKIVYNERFPDRSEASKAEAKTKKLSAKQKRALYCST